MKKPLAIVVGLLLAVAGLAALDWYVLEGPIANRAISRCTESSTGEVLAVASFGSGVTKRDESDARDLCEDAYREGTLTLRGGIDS